MLAEELDLEEISEDIFNIEDSILYASEYIETQNKGNLFIGQFEDDLWRVFDDNHVSYRNFDFRPLYAYFSADESMVSVIKCWVTGFLQEYRCETACTHFKNLLDFTIRTNGIKGQYISDYITFVKEEYDAEEPTKIRKMFAVLNFLDYYPDLDITDETMIELFRFKKSLSKEKGSRILPSSKSIMLFSKCLEEYFDTIVVPNSVEYIRYYPILIWWKLTNIIPMRIGEFCRIVRNSLIHENNKVYIQLPRAKNPKRRVQIIDKIYLSDEMVKLINRYIEITDQFGKTATLISYRAQSATNMRTAIPREKIFKNRYNISCFKWILDSLYTLLLPSAFNIAVAPLRKKGEEESQEIETMHYDINQRLRPNDTRYLAFMNLYMQGFHPVEAARMGGHVSISTQYTYQNHVEYWVDSEVEKAMKKFGMAVNGNKDTYDITDIPSLDKKLRFRAMFVAPTYSDFKDQCGLGYCTDKKRRCRTETPYECEHWRIDEEKWDEVAPTIDEEIIKKRTNITGLHAFLENIHRLIMANNYTKINYQYSNQIVETTMKLRAEVELIARLKLKMFKKG